MGINLSNFDVVTKSIYRIFSDEKEIFLIVIPNPFYTQYVCGSVRIVLRYEIHKFLRLLILEKPSFF